MPIEQKAPIVRSCPLPGPGLSSSLPGATTCNPVWPLLDSRASIERGIISASSSRNAGCHGPEVSGWEFRAAVASSCRCWIPAMQSCIYVPGPTIRCRGMNGQLGCDGQCNSHIGRTWAAIQLHRPSLSPKSTYQPIPTTSEYVSHQPTTRYVRRETVR